MLFLPVKDIRELDSRTIVSGTPGALLMERAGYGAFRFLKEVCAPKARRFLVLGGAGNNGGDAWVVARYLIQEGLHCDVCLLGPIRRLRGDALLQLERLESLGAKVACLLKPEDVMSYVGFWQGDAIVDGLVGIGFHGGAEALLAAAISAVNSSSAKVFSLDIPSGVPADGSEARLAVRADWTATFGAAKLAMLGSSKACFGRTELIDIGWAPIGDEMACARAIGKSEADSARIKPGLLEHKHSRGHLAIFAGGKGMGGAALLAAEAASNSGAGLVTAIIPESLVPAMNARLPHVLTLGLTGGLAKDREAIEALLIRTKALVAGPGLAPDDYHYELLKTCLGSPTVKQVWDAGALSLFSRFNSDELNGRQLVLTPHEGEFERLAERPVPKGDKERMEAAKDLASATSQTVLLKGHHTVIASKEGLPYVNLSGNPLLATAGSGDVLSGIIGAFLANGLDTETAAVLGAYYHGLAADLLGAQGPFNATSLAQALPRALA